jgi:hypothetical protein
MANWWDKNLTDKQKFRLQEPKDPSLLDVVSTVPNPVGDVASGLLAAQDFSKGNYGSAALNSLGLLPFVPSMGAVISGYGKNANEMANILNPLHPNIDADLMGNNAITLSKIIANKKNAGYGTDFMNDLIRLADEKGISTNLSPSSDFGGNKNRLKDFYKQFGFVENKGKNKDFTINESMYRKPKLDDSAIKNVSTSVKTDFEKAQDLAQQRASLPVSEGGLGLPATNTSIDRAKAMGFDTGKKWLHGTRDDFGEFSRTKDIGYHFGDKWQANDRAGAGYESNVIPVYLKNDNIINTDDVYGASSTFPIYGNLVDKGHISQNEVDNIFQNVIRADHDKALSNLLKSKNYGGIEYDNMVEGIRTNLRKNGDKNTARIVLDSSQIRSPNAAFDPFRRNEADILAGVGVGVPVASGLLDIENKKVPKKEKKKTK